MQKFELYVHQPEELSFYIIFQFFYSRTKFSRWGDNYQQGARKPINYFLSNKLIEFLKRTNQLIEY